MKPTYQELIESLKAARAYFQALQAVDPQNEDGRDVLNYLADIAREQTGKTLKAVWAANADEYDCQGE